MPNTNFFSVHRAAIAAAILAMTGVAQAQTSAAPRAIAATCVNPASGATWQISIDFDRSTVDANPATISSSEIAWQDARDQWSYRLDRGTGELRVAVASSTGGYFLHDRCQLPP